MTNFLTDAQSIFDFVTLSKDAGVVDFDFVTLSKGLQNIPYKISKPMTGNQNGG
ncbi:hypothetical protein BGP_2752 [Beggiatoa sp. PS]|nr:hypothetical protein BGP_2752 [Beggiatoa sp. PS]